MLDWLNFRLGEIIGLIQALQKRYYQNKTQLRYNFGSVYTKMTRCPTTLNNQHIDGSDRHMRIAKMV